MRTERPDISFGSADMNDSGAVSEGEFTKELQAEFGNTISRGEFGQIQDYFGKAADGLKFGKLADDDGVLKTKDLAEKLFGRIDRNDNDRISRGEWKRARGEPEESGKPGGSAGGGSGGGAGAGGSSGSDKPGASGGSGKGKGPESLEDLKFRDLDRNDSGQISVGEAARGVMKLFDKNESGKIGGKELKALTEFFGLDKDQAKKLAGRDGSVNRSELEKFFKKEFKDGDYGKSLSRSEFADWKENKIADMEE